MRLTRLVCSPLLLLAPIILPAQRADIAGSQDHPLISRYPGMVISNYRESEFNQFVLPLSKVDPATGRAFMKSQKIEGKVTEIYYEKPEGRSTLEIYHNYEDAL